MLDHVDQEDKVDGVTIRDSIGREQKAVFINESGLYSLILSSKLPQAKYENADALVKQQAANDMSGRLCWFELNVSVSEYTDKDGFERKRSQLTLLSVKPCW